MCIFKHTVCMTCGFFVYNAVWDGGDDGLQYRGWMAGEDTPEDLPEAVRAKADEEFGKSA
jgi:hypothetical protein